MQHTQVQIALSKTFVGKLEGVAIFFVVLSYEFGENCFAFQPTARMDTQNEIAGRASSSSVPIYKWVDVVKPPQYESCQQNRVCLIPTAVHLVDKVVHQRGDAVVLRWEILVPNVHLAWPVFTSVRMKAGDSVKVESFDYLLREKPLIDVYRNLNNGIQKLILTIPVGNRQRFVIRIVFGVEKLK